MDIAESRLNQDGVFNMAFANKVVDFRTVTVPVTYGEYVVLRILDPDSVRNSLDGLGITRVEHWRRGFNQMNGLCLICGPTGSGKTTTLNGTISEMDRFGDSIFTVEDPVEYPMVYAGQVSVNPAVGLDYAQALRAFMRSDPDIINIGEVRDEETARTMVRAAETGHMVLATLHASTIRGAVSRLEYLDIPAHDLRFIMRSIMVQNLIRTLCTECRGAGCPTCFDTGYGGRRIVSEVQSFMNEHEFDRMANGEVFWPTIIEDAVDAMLEGWTDFRELDRVYGPRAHDEMQKRGLEVPEEYRIRGSSEKEG
jgi:general secretion pathway protein E